MKLIEDKLKLEEYKIFSIQHQIKSQEDFKKTACYKWFEKINKELPSRFGVKPYNLVQQISQI